jgi:hypothetical protein
MATDFLEEKRREIRSRMKQLEPAIDEHRRLEAALAALESVDAPARPAAARRRGKGAKPAPGAPRPRGRPKGSGTRRAEALAIVTANPGVTVAEIAAKLGINQNYLYRVLPALAKDGLIVRNGGGWEPAGAA